MCAGRPRTYQYYCHHWYGVLHTQLEVFSKNVDCNFFSDYLCQMKQQSIVRYRNPLLFQRLSPFFLFFLFSIMKFELSKHFFKIKWKYKKESNSLLISEQFAIFTTACLPVLQHSLSVWWNKNIYMKLSSAL